MPSLTGSKVAVGIHNSKCGSTARNAKIKEDAERMRILSDSIAITNVSAKSAPEQSLPKIASKCGELTNELMDVIDGLAVAEDGGSRLLSAFRQGIRSAAKKKKLDEIVDRMGSLRAEMTLNIVSLME